MKDVGKINTTKHDKAQHMSITLGIPFWVSISMMILFAYFLSFISVH